MYCSVTPISYKKIADRFTCVAFVETSYSNTDTCKFESLQSEASRASDVASPIFFGGAKHFDFKRGTALGLIQHFSKYKMKRYARSLEGDHWLPWLRL